MPQLMIDLSVNGTKVDSQMSQVGRRASQRFASEMDRTKFGTGLFSNINGLASGLANKINNIFGRAGEASGKSFGSSFLAQLSGAGLGGFFGVKAGVKSGSVKKLYGTFDSEEQAKQARAYINYQKSEAFRKQYILRNLPPMGKSFVAPTMPEGAAGAAGAAGLSRLGPMAAGAIAALGVGSAVKSLITSTLETASSLADMSEQTGYTIDTLQAMSVTAKDAGSSLDKILLIDRNLQNARLDALGGNEKQMQLFNQLGISADALKNSSNVLETVAGGAKGGKDINRVLGQLLGDKNVGVFRATQGQLSNIAGTTADLRNQGRVANPEDVMALDELSKDLQALKDEWQITIMPALVSFGKFFVELINVANDVLHSVWTTFKERMKNWTSYIPGLGQFFNVAALGKNISKTVEERATEREVRRYNRALARDQNKANKTLVGSTGGAQPMDNSALSDRIPKFSDAQVAIGNFLGSATNDLNSIQREQLGILKQVKQVLDEEAKWAKQTVELLQLIEGSQSGYR